MNKILFVFIFIFLTISGTNALSMVDENEVLDVKIYWNSQDFLESEWLTCSIATDGCNTVHIIDGKLGAMTKMYCGVQEWSCLDNILEDERIWFLSDNDRNQYYVFQNNLWEETSAKIESAVWGFWSKILEKVLYDIEEAIIIIDRAISSFETVISNLIMSYPADSWMSEPDTQKYYILTIAKFELKILKQRWLRNSK